MHLKDVLFFPIGCSAACMYCSQFLQQSGFSVTDHPTPEVTHLLLDVPGFQSNGLLRNGEDIRPLLRMLPPDIIIIGGRLQQAALSNYQTWDLLSDEEYLARNAAITAVCALQIAMEQLPVILASCPVLILGWGRIGKCLGQLLQRIGATVTIAARKASDLAMAQALGYQTVEIEKVQDVLQNQRLVFNTVPQLLLTEADTTLKSCAFIDLASQPGMLGDSVIQALGLPGKYAPESSGKLIADTILKQIKEGTP